MKHVNIIGILVAGAAALWIAGCGNGDGTGPIAPVPGTLTVSLTTPNADDRAIHLSIEGAAAADSVSNVQVSSASFTAFSRDLDGNEVATAVFGDLANGALVRFSVPDVNRASSYSATIVDVADASNEVRGSLSGYSLDVGE